MYRYENGLIIGRFQSFHKGHEHIINTALSLCKNVFIYIGSSQESETEHNPFTYVFRKTIIEKCFSEEIKNKRIVIAPLKDAGIGDNSDWGDYVVKNFEKDFNTIPNVIISGEEAQRIAWFSKSQPIDTVYVPKILNISATKLREAILENNFEYWKQYTNDKIWDKFIKMRKIILEIRRNKK